MDGEKVAASVGGADGLVVGRLVDVLEGIGVARPVGRTTESNMAHAANMRKDGEERFTMGTRDLATE